MQDEDTNMDEILNDITEENIEALAESMRKTRGLGNVDNLSEILEGGQQPTNLYDRLNEAWQNQQDNDQWPTTMQEENQNPFLVEDIPIVDIEYQEEAPSHISRDKDDDSTTYIEVILNV